MVADDEEAKSAIFEIEPLLLEDDELNVYELIEDEILLALPIVALHQIDQGDARTLITERSATAGGYCQEAQVTQEVVQEESGEVAGQEAKNPFAELKQMKFNR